MNVWPPKALAWHLGKLAMHIFHRSCKSMSDCCVKQHPSWTQRALPAVFVGSGKLWSTIAWLNKKRYCSVLEHRKAKLIIKDGIYLFKYISLLLLEYTLWSQSLAQTLAYLKQLRGKWNESLEVSSVKMIVGVRHLSYEERLRELEKDRKHHF